MNTTHLLYESHACTGPGGDSDGDRSCSAVMLNDPLVQAFERTTLDPTAFRHREHLSVAWCYLRSLPLEEALARYVYHLRQLTIALGVPHKFHATMTWAYVVLLRDAIDQSPSVSFDELLAQHPVLLDRHAALAPHYERGQLDSEEARRRFVLPRRG